MRISNLDAGIGWKRLKKTLKNLQQVVNKNAPVKGHGIQIQETDTGSIISVDPKTDDQQMQTLANLEAGKWLQVDVVDANCNRTTIWVWGSTTNPTGGSS